MEPEKPTPPVAGAVCANCGAPLYGEYCHHCGQPVKGLIRHLSGVIGDVFDTVLNIDARVVRTLPALFFKPGFLTLEYFAGRRVRYVTPFRLMFFLALAAFFVMQVAVSNANWNPPNKAHTKIPITGASKDLFHKAQDAAQVKAIEQRELANIERAEANPQLPAIARAPLEVARQQIRSAAADRLAALKHAQARLAADAAPSSSGGAAPASSVANTGDDFGNVDLPQLSGWKASEHPLHVSWWPDSANAWLNQVAQRAHDNFVLAFKSGDSTARRAAWRALIIGTISVLPQTMFVLLPLFALILKIFYLFKRRLYMEHLIVALHSHAFIFLTLLLLFALSALHSWLAPIGWLFGLLTAATWIWLFVYLFLMQKRVYMQGWFFTGVKYWCVGICYTVLLSFALVIAVLLSLVMVHS